MRRRDFLKGLAAVVGVGVVKAAEIPWAKWEEHTKPKEAFDFSWHTTTTSKEDFTEAVRHLYSHGVPEVKARILNVIVNAHGQLEAKRLA